MMKINKVAVLNYSGNVGKTTVARHLLAPRMAVNGILAVESINADGAEDEAGDRVKGKDYATVIERALLEDSVLVDVGASNIEVFMAKMDEYRGSHKVFDYFVIPTTPVEKQQRDTVATVDALRSLGVQAKAIRVVFNMSDNDILENQYNLVLEYAGANPAPFALRKGAVLHLNDIYGQLGGYAGQSIKDIANDNTDLKSLLSGADTGGRQKVARMIAIRMLARGVVEEQDKVFDCLFG